jgi:hypothetical protein
VTFALPAAVVVPEPEEDVEFAFTSPAEGEELDSRTVAITGTGTNGSTIRLFDGDGREFGTDFPVIVADGVWQTTFIYPEASSPIQFLDATQITDGEETAYASTYFFLPYDLVDPPVITSPTDGETIAGDRVTFTGIGEPGADLLLLVIPTDELEGDEAQSDELEGAMRLSQQRVAAAAEPSDPEDPVIVDENGQWTVTYELEPDDYTTAAIQLDAESGFPISDLSELVAFALVPAVAVDNPDEGTDDGPGEGLAVTGSESTGFLGLAAVLLVAGAALVVVNRRVARFEPARVDAAGID